MYNHHIISRIYSSYTTNSKLFARQGLDRIPSTILTLFPSTSPSVARYYATSYFAKYAPFRIYTHTREITIATRVEFTRDVATPLETRLIQFPRGDSLFTRAVFVILVSLCFNFFRLPRRIQTIDVEHVFGIRGQHLRDSFIEAVDSSFIKQI